MNLFRQYDKNDFYCAEVVTIPPSYEKDCEELGTTLMFRPKERNLDFTLLLKNDECYIDVLHPNREILLERDSSKESTLIHWQHSLGEYNIEVLLSTLNIIQAIYLFYKYRKFLMEYSQNLESNHPIDLEGQTRVLIKR